MGNKSNEFTIRTKKPNTYFTGRIHKYYFIGERWHISCYSYSGGNSSILDMIDWECKTKKEIIQRIRKLKKRYNLVLNWKLNA